MKNLVNVLRQAGKPARTCKTRDGTRMLVPPCGGRGPGVFPAKKTSNWTHPALESVKPAREFYAGDGSMKYRAQPMLRHLPLGRQAPLRRLPTRCSSLPRRRAATLPAKFFALTAAGQRADSSGTFDLEP